jgi:subtilisin family serine protease
VAPGVDVLSAAPGLISNNAYSYRSGTAVAASQVAGVLALMIGADKANGDAEAFRKQRSRYISYLSSTAQDKGDSGRDDSYGYGLVDAAAALAKSLGQANDSFN